MTSGRLAQRRPQRARVRPPRACSAPGRRGCWRSALRKRLDQIGHNLSQIVKNAHLFRQASPLIIEQLCRTIDQIITEALEERPDGP